VVNRSPTDASDFEVAGVGRTPLSDAFDFAFDFVPAFNREGHGLQPCRKRPTQFDPASAAAANRPSKSFVIPNRAESPVRNLLFPARMSLNARA